MKFLCYFITLLTISQSLTVITTSAQMSKKERKDAAWKMDISHSGVGIDFTNYKYGKDAFTEKAWKGVSISMGPIYGGYAQGVVSADYVVNRFISETKTRSQLMNANRWYVGTNIPLKFLTFGNYTSYKNVFRGNPFINSNLGKSNFKEQQSLIKSSVWHFTLGVGYRLRIPYGAIDFGLESNINFGGDEAHFDNAFKGLSYQPTLALRLDGLLEKFNPRSVTTDATVTRIDGVSTYTNNYTETRSDGSRYNVKETHTTYNYTVSPTTINLTDIGFYRGLGIKVATNGIGTNYYSNQGYSAGLTFLGRAKAFVFGADIEYGKIGHATTVRGGANPEKRSQKAIEKKQGPASGHIQTVNTMLQIGMDLNSYLIGMGGIGVENGKVTPFISFNGGYSFGFSALLNQKFSNQQTADIYLQSQRETSKYNDASQSKSGFVSAWYLATDIGTTSFKLSWYKYRNAPLANNISLSMAWRMFSSNNN